MEMFLVTDELNKHLPATPKAIREAEQALTLPWNDLNDLMSRMPVSRQTIVKLRSWLAFEMNKPIDARAYIVERLLARIQTMRRKMEVEALNEIVDKAIKANRVKPRRESADSEEAAEATA